MCKLKLCRIGDMTQVVQYLSRKSLALSSNTSTTKIVMCMYVNGKMIPDETIPGMRRGEKIVEECIQV
jgi:hypothetical protein